jgi:hypothetical protein
MRKAQTDRRKSFRRCVDSFLTSPLDLHLEDKPLTSSERLQAMQRKNNLQCPADHLLRISRQSRVATDMPRSEGEQDDRHLAVPGLILFFKDSGEQLVCKTSSPSSNRLRRYNTAASYVV